MDQNNPSGVSTKSNQQMQMQEGESDGDFLLRLFEAYYDRIYCFARKSAPPEVAEDVTQEVFLRLLQHPRFNTLQLTSSYLIKIAHNLLRRRHSRWVKLQEILDSIAAEQASNRRRETHTLEEDEDSKGRIEGAMTGLNTAERDALELIICRGLSYQQAAKSLNTSITTINNRKYRGLQKLKQIHEQTEDLRKRA